ncbi:MAG TPA: cell division protein ZipA C-terminal FtsZ-binding domain-containing protein, partial [Burkholderiales bacterium]|nr:cell division protein ZipA C-terminal FtsZ-binding domain-containing protein [Burkholderiales bacterium]
MSNLQISLILIGALFVVGIFFFNWWQQRNHRRKTESLFESRHDDVLLDDFKPVPVREERVEHQFVDLDDDDDDEEIVAEEEAPVLTEIIGEEEQIRPSSTRFVDAETDYIAEIQAKDHIGAEELAELFRRKFDFGKALGVYGLNIDSGCWEEPHAKPKYRNFKISLQLVDRSGVVTLAKLSEFRDLVVETASRLGASSLCPDISEAHSRAIQLDKFCAEVDMLIGINVMSRGEETFAGTKIRGLAEAAGFRLETDGTFRYFDEHGTHLFSLCNHEPAVFLPDGIRHLSTHGITFLLDVPRVAHGKQAFDQMISLAKSFAGTLGGVIVDDKRLMLNDAGFDKIRKLLQEIRAKMEGRQIPPGSERALRL